MDHVRFEMRGRGTLAGQVVLWTVLWLPHPRTGRKIESHWFGSVAASGVGQLHLSGLHLQGSSICKAIEVESCTSALGTLIVRGEFVAAAQLL